MIFGDVFDNAPVINQSISLLVFRREGGRREERRIQVPDSAFPRRVAEFDNFCLHKVILNFTFKGTNWSKTATESDIYNKSTNASRQSKGVGGWCESRLRPQKMVKFLH